MTFRSEQYTMDCPEDECDTELTFWTEEGENGPYADGSYQTWTFLMMEGDACPNGHTFTPEQVEKLEERATNDYQQLAYEYDD